MSLATMKRPTVIASRRILSLARHDGNLNVAQHCFRPGYRTLSLFHHNHVVSNGFHRRFSTDSLPRQSLSHAPSLGLFEALVKPQLKDIASLPEVEAAIQNEPSAASIDGLKRAVDIFEAMGGPLHTAVLALLADAYQETGQYKETVDTLEKLACYGRRDQALSIQLALSKALFYNGEFDRALTLVSELLETPNVQASALERGIILSAQGTIQLLQLRKDRHKYDDAQEVIKVMRVAATSLAHLQPSAAAIAYNNLGIAQILSEQVFLDKKVRVDAAMSTFHKSLEMATANEFLKGRIYNNMATTLLLEDLDEDDDMLQVASEYSRKALKIYENATSLSESEKQAGLGRSLGLVASCYAIAEAAVTAEGLFQTAIDMKGVDPLTVISRRDVYHRYSLLCKDWDKREADGDRLDQQSIDMNNSLADGWKDKPTIICGLVYNTLC